MINPPDKKELISYVIQTLKNDHIKVDINVVNDTLEKRNMDSLEKSYCAGQFKAINYVMKLYNSFDFPIKKGMKLDNDFLSNQALFWLRELHTLMMSPVAEYGNKNKSILLIQNHQCGTYRYEHKLLAFSQAPEPSLVPKILHQWIKSVSKLDNDIKDKVANPYSISQSQGREIYQTLNEIPLFFSCLQPFADGNNMIGKLVENIFRLRWNLPWRTIHEKENEQFIRDLTQYQEKPTGFSRWVNVK